MRWLLSCVPSFMIFDDHDVIDDWNTSQVWHEQIERQPWWRGRIQGALMSYWIYQHLGEAAFRHAEDDELLAEVRGGGRRRAGPAGLRRSRRRRHAEHGRPPVELPPRPGALPPHHPRLPQRPPPRRRPLHAGRRGVGLVRREGAGRGRPRADRHIGPVDPPSPAPRPRGLGRGGGRRGVGRRAAGVGERIREAVDLEHWAAFGSSFEDLAAVVRSIAAGERGPAPATVLALSGDVHFGYVAEADLGGTSRVRQVVSSPLRHVSPLAELKVQQLAMGRAGAGLARALVRATRRPRPSFGWRITDGPWFHNQVADLRARRPPGHAAGRAGGARRRRPHPAAGHAPRAPALI